MIEVESGLGEVTNGDSVWTKSKDKGHSLTTLMTFGQSQGAEDRVIVLSDLGLKWISTLS